MGTVAEYLAPYKEARARTRERRQVITQLPTILSRLNELEAAEARRQELGMRYTAIIRSVGWWIGAFGLSEGIKGLTWHTIPAVREVPIVTGVQNVSAWIIGCAVGAGLMEKLVTPLGLRLDRRAGSKNTEQA